MMPTDTKYKAVDFIETYTGRAVFPLAPSPEMFSIIDIAHHLSNQCRYSGATERLYSTAQHCCILADYVEKVRGGSPLDCLQMLMHDSAEAYLVDVPRPVKQHMPEYRKWDYNLTMCIRAWVGLGDLPIPEWQDELDSRIIVDEREQCFMPRVEYLDWQHHVSGPLGVGIDAWTPPHAEQQFLMRYASYTMKIWGQWRYLRGGWGVKTDSTFQPFRSVSTDTPKQGPVEPRVVTDLIEVDFLGNVGRVALRSPNGMMVRDTRAGQFPTAAWQFIHGKFDLIKGAEHGVGKA